ncbi:hypothetical protein [Rhodoferax aquaticus]|uniref:Uncharacterized protein n=1 Tax=Rhodoferax aquaticus TaxID=2527691 RepID=A0A515ETE5_9BURK|nr:hypothetical protein [Rhodoferax aquaticus]QDL55929.1 hypothetical protein EXZ61_18075 [Rhodoferax aquaticus]
MAKNLVLIALIALVAVEHDGVKYGPGQDAGDKLELPEAQAKPLLEVGAVKLDEPVAAADGGGDGTDGTGTSGEGGDTKAVATSTKKK